MKRLLGIAIAGMLCGTAAQAADVTDPLYDWSGLYVGVHAGYVFGDADYEFGGGSGTIDIEGFAFGGLAGYNYQMDRIVLGLEGDVQLGEIDGVGGRFDDFDIEPVGRIRARLGFAMDNIMPFVAGGLSLGDGDLRLPGAGAPDELHIGFNIGAGIDVGLTENLIVRGEYIFDAFGDKNYNFPNGTANIDVQTSTVRGALIWKF